MIFAPNYVRDTHRDVIDHIDEVEAWTAVFAYEDEVHFFSALDSTAHLIIDDNGGCFNFLDLCFQIIVVSFITFAFEFEPDCAIFFVGAPHVCKFFKILVVDWLALALKVRAVIAAHFGSLIPVHSHPLHAFE